ncbi:MAG TPA: AraC family transcriptional regulator [Opitutus sp.]|nr:AraC family transcriptional regulator [Opitutus sp.]
MAAAMNQAYWCADDSDGGPLQYLSWGARYFGSPPLTESRPTGWSYVVVESGMATLVGGNRSQQVRGPALVLIGPQCVAKWLDAPLQGDKHLVWVWRRPVHALLTRMRPDSLVYHALEASDVSELRHLHVLSRSEVFRGDLHSETALTGLQSLLEARIARIGEGRTVDPRKETIDRALQWIETHVSSRQPLARLADFLGVSPATVQRLFRERLGTTVMKSVAEIRRREAERMLRRDGASIKEIAYRLGYRHPHDFSRAFRNHTGKLPSHWAARMEASS